MIVFDNVSLHYHYDEYALLKNLSFELNDGVNTVLCDVQSGKSSVCKLLTKEFAPSGGVITVNEVDISRITNECLGILYLPSKPVFFENKSVLYNMAYPLKVRRTGKKERLQTAMTLADKLGIDNVDVKVSKLTACERKRVALARGLTVDREIVLFDDFFDENDDVDSVLDMFSARVKVILTSQADIARGNCIVLDGGNTVFCGDVKGARECVSQLEWLYDNLRRNNG